VRRSILTSRSSATGQKQPTCLAPACLLSPAADILRGKIIIPTPPAARARRRTPGRHALRPLRAFHAPAPALVKGTDTLGFLKRGSVASGDLLGSARRYGHSSVHRGDRQVRPPRWPRPRACSWRSSSPGVGQPGQASGARLTAHPLGLCSVGDRSSRQERRCCL
jgi:hypothetical protein